MAYVSFNHLTDRFSEQIYNTRKGRLRMHLIDALYQRHLPTEMAHWHTLDVAGGMGQMTRWFLERQVRVDYFDVADAMVAKVNSEFSESISTGQLNSHCASIASYDTEQQYDFVNSHAVLEWLEDPLDALNRISTWVKPGGYIGLMIYNKHMLMLRHLMRGTLSKAMSGKLSGDKKGLTPINPLEPSAISARLGQLGFNIVCQAGVRSFSDLSEPTVIDWYDEQDVFNAELELCCQAPYRDMARYVLFIAQKSVEKS